MRGTVHWLTHADGPARALLVDPAARARLPRVLGKTGKVAWVTDARGADAIQIAEVDAEQPGRPGPSRRRSRQRPALEASPDGAKLAVAAADGRLMLIDVESGELTELASNDDGEMEDIAWSPDSAWLAWAQPGPQPLARIRLARVADGSRWTSPTAGSSTATRSSPPTGSTWRSCPAGPLTRSTTCTSSTCRSRSATGPTWCRWPRTRCRRSVP